MTRRRSTSRTRTRVLARSVELSLAAPVVIAARTGRMLAAGATPSAADRREMLRMGTEKMQAFQASFAAMAWELQRVQIDWWMRAMRAWWIAPWSIAPSYRHPGASELVRAWHDVVDSGLAPVHRAATANARRLHRRR